MMNLVVKLVYIEVYDPNDKCCSIGIIYLRDLQQNFSQCGMMFQEIPVFLMMLEPESFIKKNYADGKRKI